jgi:hypothetical protein
MRWDGKPVVLTIVLSPLVSILSIMLQSGVEVAHSQASGGFVDKPIPSEVMCVHGAFAKELPPPGPACEKELFARLGKPYMFPARNGIAFGVSSDPNKSTRLFLWVDNQTEKSINFFTCCSQTLYEYIDIYGPDGHRLLNKQEHVIKLNRLKRIEDPPQICTCAGSPVVPPHNIDFIDSDDISPWYDLPPGRYIISERNPPALYNLGPDAVHVPPELAISIP